MTLTEHTNHFKEILLTIDIIMRTFYLAYAAAAVIATLVTAGYAQPIFSENVARRCLNGEAACTPGDY